MTEEELAPKTYNTTMMQTPLVRLVNEILAIGDKLVVLRKNPPAPSNVNALTKAMELEKKYIDLREEFIQMTSTGVVGQGNAEYAARAFGHEAKTTFASGMGLPPKARKARKARKTRKTRKARKTRKMRR